MKQEKGNATSVKKVGIRVIGVGGGGGNIVAQLSEKLSNFSSQKIDFLALNTDLQALESLPGSVRKYPFGEDMTQGLGTGRNPEFGEKVARKEKEKLEKLFVNSKDLYIIVSSLGGGTGSGTAPVLARIASEKNITTLGIFTFPFEFEGKQKDKIAKKAFERIKQDLNATLVIPNEKIFSISKEDISFNNALKSLNENIASSLENLLRVIYEPGLINIDWADVKSILSQKRKKAYLNIAKTDKLDNLEAFAQSLLKNPILNFDFKEADNILFNIEASKGLSIKQLAAISQKIGALSPKARIIFGLMQNPKIEEGIVATILSTGGAKQKKKPSKKQEKKPLKPKKKTPKPKQKEEEKEVKIRRSALDIKEAEKVERAKDEEEENIFEVPAFLRKNKEENKEK